MRFPWHPQFSRGSHKLGLVEHAYRRELGLDTREGKWLHIDDAVRESHCTPESGRVVDVVLDPGTAARAWVSILMGYSAAIALPCPALLCLLCSVYRGWPTRACALYARQATLCSSTSTCYTAHSTPTAPPRSDGRWISDSKTRASPH